MIKEFNLIEALLHPEEVFSSPKEVLSLDIRQEDKIKILQLWEDEIRQLQACDEENMSGGEEQTLRQVHNAMLELMCSENDIRH